MTPTEQIRVRGWQELVEFADHWRERLEEDEFDPVEGRDLVSALRIFVQIVGEIEAGIPGRQGEPR